MVETPDENHPVPPSSASAADVPAQPRMDASANSVQGDQYKGNVINNFYGSPWNAEKFAEIRAGHPPSGSALDAQRDFVDPTVVFEVNSSYEYSHDCSEEEVSEYWAKLMDRKFLLLASDDDKWVTEAAYRLCDKAAAIRRSSGECRVLEGTVLEDWDMAKILENRGRIGGAQKTILFVFVHDRMFLDSVYPFEEVFFERQVEQMGEFRVVLCLSSIVWNNGADARYRQSRLPKWTRVLENGRGTGGDLAKLRGVFDAGRPSRVIPLFIGAWFSGITSKEFEELVVLAAGDEDEEMEPAGVTESGEKKPAVCESVAAVFKKQYRVIFDQIGVRFEHEEGVGRVSQPPAGCSLGEIKEMFWGDSILVSRHFDRLVESRWLWRTEGSERRASLGSFYNLAADLAREEPASYGVPWLMKLVDELNEHVRVVGKIVGDGRLAEEISTRPYVRIFANLCRSFMQNSGGVGMVDTFIGKLLNEGEQSLALRLVASLRHTLGASYLKWIRVFWDQGNAETRSRNLRHVLLEFGDNASTISMCLGEISTWLPEPGASQMSPRALYAVGFMRCLVDRILNSLRSDGRNWQTVCEVYLKPILSAEWSGVSGHEWLRHPLLDRAIGMILDDEDQKMHNTPEEAMTMMVIDLSGSELMDDAERASFAEVVGLLYRCADNAALHHTRNLLRDLGYSAKEAMGRPDTDKSTYHALKNLHNNIATIKRTIDNCNQYE